MHLALLTDEYMASYWEIVKQDYVDYYFFIYDVLEQPDRTKVWLALEREEIVGLMLVYNNSLVQLRGGPEAVGFLLSSLNLETVDVAVPADCEDMVLAKFPVYKTKENMTIMKLEKGKENLNVKVEPERLTEKDADELARLMRETYPLMWSEMTCEKVKVLTSPKDAVLLGIRVEKRLVAFGTGVLTSPVGFVNWLGTLEKFRHQNYCSSIISALVREGLKAADCMAIHVLDNNAAALSVYMRIGFKPYKSYVMLRT